MREKCIEMFSLIHFTEWSHLHKVEITIAFKLGIVKIRNHETSMNFNLQHIMHKTSHCFLAQRTYRKGGRHDDVFGRAA